MTGFAQRPGCAAEGLGSVVEIEVVDAFQAHGFGRLCRPVAVEATGAEGVAEDGRQYRLNLQPR